MNAGRRNPFFQNIPSLVTVICLCACFFLFLFFTIPAMHPPLFRGYLTLYFRGDAGDGNDAHKIALAIKNSSGIQAVLSEYTSEVEATNFDREVQVTQADLAARFDPQDPRLDPYMKGLAAYFSVSDGAAKWSIMYIKTRLNPIYLSMLLSGIVGDMQIEWHIYELERTEITLVISIVGTLFLFLLLLFFQDQAWRIVMSLGLLPWISWAAGGGIGAFILFFPCAFAWAMFSHEMLVHLKNRIQFKWDEPAGKSLGLTSALYGATVIAGVVSSASEIPVYSVFFVILTQGFICGAYALLLTAGPWWKKKNKLTHRTFHAVRLVKKYDPLRRGRTERLVLRIMACFLIVIPCMRLLPGTGPRQLLPVPERMNSSAWWPSREALVALAEKRTEGGEAGSLPDPGSLPDLSDYAAHVAYQERLVYGGMKYGLPDKDERIRMPAFSLDAAGRIVKSSEEVVSFNAAWFDGLTSRPAIDSVARMLFEQGSPVSVRVKKQIPASDSTSVWTIILNWCILLWPLIITHSRFFLAILQGVDKDTQLLLRELR